MSDDPTSEPSVEVPPEAPVKAAAKAPVKAPAKGPANGPAKATAKAPAKKAAKAAAKAPAKRATAAKSAPAPVVQAGDGPVVDPGAPVVEPDVAVDPPVAAEPGGVPEPVEPVPAEADVPAEAVAPEAAAPVAATPVPETPEPQPDAPIGPSVPMEPESLVDEDPAERKGLPLWQESLLLVGVALVLAILIKAFFVQAFYIPSDSMEPGLVDNDRILVEKPSYWGGGSPQRGDVIVFKDPNHWLVGTEDAGPGNVIARALAKVGLFPSGGHLVKRVIGVAGDTITCCDATTGQISVNGKPLDEKGYVLQEKNLPCYGPQTGDCEWTAGPVPKGELFVMGDNRAHSGDSSTHLCTADETECTDDPYVKVSLVTGKVFNLVWPLSHFTFLHRPSDFASIPDPQ